MLNVLAKEDFEKCIGFAYDLALDPTITSYPVYYDGVKTREDFIRRAEEAFHNQNEEILLFSDEDSALGWIHYYYLPEDNYLGTVSLSIRKNKETAMDEFLLYVEQKYPGCHIYLGFPEENQEAISALIHHDFQISEQLWNNVLDLSHYPRNRISQDIIRIGRENYCLFSDLHAKYEAGMYWNNERILNRMDDWMIFAYKNREKVSGVIYCFQGIPAEVFGIDFSNDEFNEDVYRHLLNAVIMACQTIGSEHLVFFGDDNDQPNILSAGFRCVGKYILMTYGK